MIQFELQPIETSQLADVAIRYVDAVVVYKVDRLTRSLADFAKIVEQIDGQGVRFVSVTQPMHPDARALAPCR